MDSYTLNEGKLLFKRTDFDNAKRIWGHLGVFRETYRNGFDKDYYVCITAYLDKKPIAFAVKTFDEKSPGESNYLSYTYVNKKHRGKGMAKMLTRRLLKYGSFTLQISPLNFISLSSHIHMGFKIVDLDLSHSRFGFIDISKKKSFYKVGRNFEIPIAQVEFVNNLFQKFSVEEIKFLNAKKSLGTINTHYKYYVGMYNLKYVR
jgi:GNAT superfamily N-acetyltransferase